MDRLNELLHELGISKVKLSKFLGVSRQMIYNYLELDDINKWPKDKKVLLLNLLGIKSSEEIENIHVTTDYISEVEMRLNLKKNPESESNDIFSGLDDKKKELLNGIIDLIKEYMDDDNGAIPEYLFHYLQALNNTKELKYILGYVAKETGFVKPLEFAFEEEEQFIFESIMYSAMVLYRSGKASKSKLAESHRRFVSQIEQKMEDKLSRTMELNNIKAQALKELGISEINEQNASEVFEKIAEIQSRKVAFDKA
ncbi:MAG: hypothetical protein IJR82_04715 [Bacilli bacterium]|nr:hypothetical protein [Bacilli bacterium]